MTWLRSPLFDTELTDLTSRRSLSPRAMGSDTERGEDNREEVSIDDLVDCRVYTPVLVPLPASPFTTMRCGFRVDIDPRCRLEWVRMELQVDEQASPIVSLFPRLVDRPSSYLGMVSINESGELFRAPGTRGDSEPAGRSQAPLMIGLRAGPGSALWDFYPVRQARRHSSDALLLGVRAQVSTLPIRVRMILAVGMGTSPAEYFELPAEELTSGI